MLITMEPSRPWKNDSKSRPGTWESSRRATTSRASSYPLSSRITEAEVKSADNDNDQDRGKFKRFSLPGHRPRYMAAGVIAMVAYCLLNSAPHFMYGPGDDALALTEEYGGIKDEQQSKALQDMNNQKLICQTNSKNICDFLTTLTFTIDFQAPPPPNAKKTKATWAPNFICLQQI